MNAPVGAFTLYVRLPILRSTSPLAGSGMPLMKVKPVAPTGPLAYSVVNVLVLSSGPLRFMSTPKHRNRQEISGKFGLPGRGVDSPPLFQPAVEPRRSPGKR